MSKTAPGAVSPITAALNGIADCFGMQVSREASHPYLVEGMGNKEVKLFGLPVLFEPEIYDSVVDNERGVVVVAVHLMGSLSCVVISDGQDHKLQIFLLDGSKLDAKKNLLPKNWLRENVYRAIRPALKATYWKGMYEEKWHLMEKGTTWLDVYLQKKSERRATSMGANGLQ